METQKSEEQQQRLMRMELEVQELRGKLDAVCDIFKGETIGSMVKILCIAGCQTILELCEDHEMSQRKYIDLIESPEGRAMERAMQDAFIAALEKDGIFAFLLILGTLQEAVPHSAVMARD